MSRIGKKEITLNEGIKVNVSSDNLVTVKGPKGELTQQIPSDFTLNIEEGKLIVSRPSDSIEHKSKHGLYRTLIFNMIEGVSNGFKLEIELVGVGYRATVTGQQLDMALGFSHNVIFNLPKEVTATALMAKGKPPLVTLESIDKQLVGAVAAKIRSLRKPEPYKGKGVRFVGEIVRRKAGKTAGK